MEHGVAVAALCRSLLRVGGGSDGASPVPVATKAVAAGLGALALTSVGDVPRVQHHPATRPGHGAVRHRPEAHGHRAGGAPPLASVAASRGNRRGGDGVAAGPASGFDDHVRSSGSGRSGAGRGGRDSAESSSISASEGSRDGSSSGSGDNGGSGNTTATTVVPGTSGDGATDGKSGPDGGSDTTSTTTSSTSGSDGGSTDSGSSSTDGGG
jgi:hypothetical protein